VPISGNPEIGGRPGMTRHKAPRNRVAARDVNQRFFAPLAARNTSTATQTKNGPDKSGREES
jgi:hypothetical protein